MELFYISPICVHGVARDCTFVTFIFYHQKSIFCIKFFAKLFPSYCLSHRSIISARNSYQEHHHGHQTVTSSIITDTKRYPAASSRTPNATQQHQGHQRVPNSITDTKGYPPASRTPNGTQQHHGNQTVPNSITEAKRYPTISQTPNGTQQHHRHQTVPNNITDTKRYPTLSSCFILSQKTLFLSS